MIRARFIFSFVLTLCFYTAAVSEPSKEQCDRPRGFAPHEKIEKKADHHLLLRMSEEMSLTEEQLVKVGKVLKLRREKTAALHSQMRSTMDTLSLLVKDSTASNENITRLTKKLREQQIELQQVDQAKIKALEKLLPPRQLAQYFLLERDFRHQIMRMIRRDSNE